MTIKWKVIYAVPAAVGLVTGGIGPLFGMGHDQATWFLCAGAYLRWLCERDGV